MPTPDRVLPLVHHRRAHRKRRLTTYAMTRADAAERFPDAEPDLGTHEVRNLPEPGDVRSNTRPPTAT
jgi:hypothetical protein